MNQRSRATMVAAATGVLLLSSAQGALTLIGNTQWNDNNTREISVFGGNSYIEGFLGNPGPGVGFVKSLGTVAEYNFFNEAGTTNVIGSYASVGSRIGLASTTDTGIANQQLITNVLYTTNNPTSGTPDFTSGTHVNGLGAPTTGTINVTGLSSGTLFIIFGSNAASSRSTSLTVTQGASSVVTAGSTGFWANQDTISAAVEIDFTNVAGNTISYSYDTNNAGKFMGVILSDAVVVPEPHTALLGGLGLLALFSRRRG